MTNRGIDELVGDRLRTIRGWKNWTQAHAARLMLVSLATYQTYEHNKRHPDSEALAPLASEGVDLHWLITGVGEMAHRKSPGLSDRSSAPMGHSDTVPGHCTVLAADGVQVARIDLIPEVLAPALEWISSSTRTASEQIDWTWAARQVIGRYEWDFFTWMRSRA